MRVLYLHPAGTFGGASKSLIELFLAANKHRNFDAYVLTPGGTAAEAFSCAGMKVIRVIGLSQFDHTRFGYYRKFRWLILLRELVFLPVTILALIKIKRLNLDFDLIHANEITLLPSAALAKWILRLPLVVHVRSLQYSDINSLRSKWIFSTLKIITSKIICIDETVKNSTPDYLKAMVIRNGIDLMSTELSKCRVDSDRIVIGMAGVMHRSKGVYEFLQAAKILIKDRNRNVKFILAGDNTRRVKGLKKWIFQKLGFAEDVLGTAIDYVKQNDLKDQVVFTGYIKDIKSYYPLLDILCFPSFLNACGRPVFEAAFFSVPSVVAIKNPVEDALIHEHTGLAINEPEAHELANAIDRLILNNEFRLRLGKQSRDWAEKFYSINTNSKHLLDAYDQICKTKKNT